MKFTPQLNRTIFFLFLSFSFFLMMNGGDVNAQVSSAYNFSDNDAIDMNYLSGSTVLASGATGNSVYQNVSIGFSFRYNGKAYTSVGVSNNGFIWFGTTAPAASVISPISDATAEDGVISVYGTGLVGLSSGKLSYQTQGTAPNRTFTIEWYNYAIAAYSSESETDLQITLNECTNEVDLTLTGSGYLWGSGFSSYGQVGLRGATNSDFFNESINCNNFTWGFPGQGTVNTANCSMDGASGFLGGGCWPGDDEYYNCFCNNAANELIYTPKVSNTPSISCTNPNNACTGTSTSVPVTISNGYTPYNINWTFTNGSPTSPSGNAANVTSPYNGVTTTFGAPATDNYSITVTDAAGCEATCSGNITVTTCGATSITTGNITGSSFCACATLSVPFTSTGSFNAGNIYWSQLSNASGAFTVPVTIGTFTSQANSGNISSTIPCNTPTGTHYRIRVISSNPATATLIDNGTDLTINASVTVSVTITASPSDTICTGSTVNFTATPATGLSNTSYQWKVNGANQGTNSSSFSSSSLNNTDVVTCVLTSTGNCVSNSPATSNAITITVTNGVNPGVITSDGNSICQGTVVNLTLSGYTSGSSIQWQSSSDSLSGYTNIAGATSKNYTSVPLSTSTYYQVVVGTGPCAATTTVYKITVIPAPTASFTASVSGSVVTFTPVTSAGIVSYYWDFGNGHYSSTESPTYAYDSVGTFDVCITVKNNSNCNYTTCQNVTTFPAGINEITGSSFLNVYPDPFGSQLYITSTKLNTEVETVEMYDVLGRRVYSNNVAGIMNNPMILDVSQLTTGMYYLRIQTKDSDYVKSLMKQ